ncbi:subtilisin-like protein [Piromyces finnis]|uniref:Subtilisin-like protein n=1 Tax=Piromyces finnis TaxID=1754191 RepID=A0A1Y1VCD3_9FUNG|nr:subtilisin-like protein [Piromyces finnis]|eukprot:ORX52634.1 subtilisin-like protein [Piromyces finnis]
MKNSNYFTFFFIPILFIFLFSLVNADNNNTVNDNTINNYTINDNIINDSTLNDDNTVDDDDGIIDNSIINDNTAVDNTVDDDGIIDNSIINDNTAVDNTVDDDGIIDNSIINDNTAVDNTVDDDGIIDNSIINDNTAVDNTSNDGFYLVVVSKTVEVITSNGIVKRQDIDVNFIINEINELIMTNIDTFKNPEALEELKQENALKKRQTDKFSEFSKSSFVFPIANTQNEVLLSAYLNPNLANNVKNIPNVEGCAPDIELEAYNYNVDEIKLETQWEEVSLKNGSYSLSALSQGKFDKNLVGMYDTNYYYPSTAGEGINIIVIDRSFTLTHTQFLNEDREIKCIANVANGNIDFNPLTCHLDPTNQHGTKMAAIAAGTINGSASKSNIYTIAMKLTSINLISSLNAVLTDYAEPYKTVILMAIGNAYSTEKEDDLLHIEKLDEVLYELNQKGVIVVVAAGNSKSDVNDEENKLKSYPCYSNHTLCVGSMDVNENDPNEYSFHNTSCRGPEVDILTPNRVTVTYNNGSKNITETTLGTSNSCAITAGVVATIMSEYKSTNFTDTLMKNYLNANALQDVIENVPSNTKNLLLNNGKHIVYSGNNKYIGCGPQAGNTKCFFPYCCGSDNKCHYYLNSKCRIKNDCKEHYGICY